MEGKGQQAAAAASGMSVRTARTWQRGRLPSERKGKRRWRTRPDPFAGVWAEEVEPLLRSDVEGALTCCLTGECYRTFGGFQLTPTGQISPSRTSSISLFSAEAYTSCLAITPRHCLTLR